ncbi:YceI family protein [Marinilongibacter aquaticus]|uniref:YceI family protein n=1 Tax=Marinilongibacter aquaticus TaxID=2975157 RepID=UPI0021BD43B1|nr:YceI family protein [Marinilongibacter aquaticus]UBM60943.1 YceI family protein [Marinilongibacter aquaticus]
MQKLLLTLCAVAFLSACSSSSKSEENAETTEATEATAYSFDLSNTKLKWTAFKTPDKVGVPGTFDDISMEGNSFTINTNSVNTGNPDRDAKLKKFFFGNLSDSLITGSYGAAANGKIPVTISMNGTEKTFDFDVADSDTATVVSGSIDILTDFSGSTALDAIHEACKELHMDKTWPDVSLEVIQTK